VDLPGDDPTARLPEYTRLIAAAIGDGGDVVLVAQSLGGFTVARTNSQFTMKAVKTGTGTP
jgi:predicted alpha/beta hydrolase family esterase